MVGIFSRLRRFINWSMKQSYYISSNKATKRKISRLTLASNLPWYKWNTLLFFMQVRIRLFCSSFPYSAYYICFKRSDKYLETLIWYQDDNTCEKLIVGLYTTQHTTCLLTGAMMIHSSAQQQNGTIVQFMFKQTKTHHYSLITVKWWRLIDLDPLINLSIIN